MLTAQSFGGPLTTVFSDKVGNRILETSSLGSVTMSWTPDNKLAVSKLPSGQVVTSTFADDGVRRTKNDSGTLTVYTMNEMNTLLETDGASALKNRYVTYPDSYGGLASQRVNGVSSFYAVDSSSNTRGLTSVLGALTDIYSSTAFGVELLTGSGSVNSRRFGGEIGYVRDFMNRYQIGQRPYDAVSGAWLSMDPIGYDSGEWNPYGFVYDNPVIFVDPSGNRGVCCTIKEWINTTGKNPTPWKFGGEVINANLLGSTLLKATLVCDSTQYTGSPTPCDPNGC